MRITLTVVLLGLVTMCNALAQSAVNSELAPHGKLRVAMIGANPVLVTKNPVGTLGGISVELGKMIATRLGARLVPVVYSSPETYTQSFGRGEWDIAIGPRRASDADKVDASPDFMLVDNVYIAAPGKEFPDATSVDQSGVKIAVAQGGAPDKFLTVKLKSATLVRVPGQVHDAVEVLRTHGADVYGSNGEFVYAIAEKLPGAKVVPGAFTTVHMAVLMPKGKSTAAQSRIAAIVREAIVAGLPRRAIERQNLKGVRPTIN